MLGRTRDAWRTRVAWRSVPSCAASGRRVRLWLVCYRSHVTLSLQPLNAPSWRLLRREVFASVVCAV